MHPFDHQSPLGTITFKARWLFTELGVSAALGPVPKGYHSFSLYHLYHLRCAMVNTYRDFRLLKPCFSQPSLFVCVSWFFFFGFFMCSSWESCCARPRAVVVPCFPCPRRAQLWAHRDMVVRASHESTENQSQQSKGGMAGTRWEGRGEGP